MASFYSRFYWRIGFGSRLYDLLTPESYVESMRRLVECLPAGKNTIFLDAGCGSGGLINILKHRIQNGVYVGTDMLLEGLLSAQKKTDAGNISNNVYFAQADFTYSIPLKNNSVDIIIAHFSIYTVPQEKRGNIYREFRRLLREGGTLAVVEPLPEYSARRIVKDSIRRLSAKNEDIAAWIKKLFVYPLTYQFGLKFIERQLRNGVWLTSKSEVLCAELRENGFSVKHSEVVYADSATLVIAG